MEPRIVARGAFSVIGLRRRGRHAGDDIPALWDRFNARRAEVHAAGADTSHGATDAYGVEGIPDPVSGEWDYLAGLEADPSLPVPEGMTRWDIPAQTYAAFRCSRDTLRQEYARLIGEWLPRSGYRRAAGPEFERYGTEFDARDSGSPLHVYVPVVPRDR